MREGALLISALGVSNNLVACTCLIMLAPLSKFDIFGLISYLAGSNSEMLSFVLQSMYPEELRDSP